MKSKTNRFQSTALSLVSIIALGTTAKADMFDINDTDADFGVADAGSYDWLGGPFWNTGTDAAADAGTAATANWTSARAAYFVGAGDDTHYTVRLGPAGGSNVSVQNLAINVNAAGNAALDGAAGDVTIGNIGDAGILTLSGSNSCGAQAGGTLTVNNGIDLNAKTMFFRGGNIVINGVVSGTGASRIAFGNGFGLTTGGTLTLANTANTFAGRLVGDFINPNFTLVVTQLADGGSSSSIGTSSAQIGMNGGTLKYIGTGAQSTNLGLNITNDVTVINAAGATSADTISFFGTTTGAGGNRVITLTGTNMGANTIAFDFGNFASGTNRFNKTGLGTWVLSGTNTYTGVTSISTNGGMLQFAKTASLYNSDLASWTGGKIRVNNGATLGLNVGGTGEFTTGNVTTLLTNLGGANGSNNSGFAAGSAIGFDTTNAAGGTFTVADVIADSTGFLGGTISVTKLGTGTLILSNTNSYTGTTTVSGGTLSLASASLEDFSTVSIAAGATLDLTHGVTDTVGTLILGDTTYTSGTFNASTPGSFISGTGSIQVGEGSNSGFAGWIETNYPALLDKTAGGDPDNDGISNLMEYVLNGNPGASSTEILPAADNSDPTDLIFTFTRREESAGDTTQIFQYGTDLSGWTDISITGTPGAEVTLGTPALGLQLVTVKVPKSAAVPSGKLFGRLQVTQP